MAFIKIVSVILFFATVQATTPDPITIRHSQSIQATVPRQSIESKSIFKSSPKFAMRMQLYFYNTTLEKYIAHTVTFQLKNIEEGTLSSEGRLFDPINLNNETLVRSVKDFDAYGQVVPDNMTTTTASPLQNKGPVAPVFHSQHSESIYTTPTRRTLSAVQRKEVDWANLDRVRRAARSPVTWSRSKRESFIVRSPILKVKNCTSPNCELYKGLIVLKKNSNTTKKM